MQTNERGSSVEVTDRWWRPWLGVDDTGTIRSLWRHVFVSSSSSSEHWT